MTLMYIYYLVQEFYAIEAVMAMLSVSKYNSFEPMRYSHSRWHRDFNYFRDDFIVRFSSAIFDYTVLVVAAELRHCRRKASQYIGNYCFSWHHSRDEVYRDCSCFAPNDILEAGIRMFDTGLVQWHGGYGGEKWKQIAKAGLMKGKVGDCVFIDHCVDLSHNNSIYFDKCAGIFHLQNIGEYQTFLDLKRSCEPQMLIAEQRGYTFNRLLQRANHLNIIKAQPAGSLFSPARDESESLLLSYEPIEWGREPLDYSEGNIVPRSNLGYNMRRIDDYDDDREYARCA